MLLASCAHPEDSLSLRFPPRKTPLGGWRTTEGQNWMGCVLANTPGLLVGPGGCKAFLRVANPAPSA